MTTIPGMPAQQARAAAGKDPRGWLVWDGVLPDDLQRLEDSRAAADRDYRAVKPRGHVRPATSTEVALLSHLGYQVPDGLETTVTWPSKAVRRRRWIALENQEIPS